MTNATDKPTEPNLTNLRSGFSELAAAFLVLVLAGLSLQWAGPPLFEKWFAAQSDSGHGPLLLVLFIWVLVQARAPLAWDLRGLIIWSLGFLLQALGETLHVHFVLSLGFLLCFAGLLVFLFSRLDVFFRPSAILFLLLCVPLPEFVSTYINYQMREIATQAAYFVLHSVLPSVHRHGNEISWDHQRVFVTSACSGLKATTALLSFALLLAQFENKLSSRARLLLLSLPLAFVANTIRILIICAFVFNGKGDWIEGDRHELLGVLTFLLGLAGLVALGAVRPQFSWRPNIIFTRLKWRLWSLLFVGWVGISIAGAEIIVARAHLPVTVGAFDVNQLPDTVGSWSSKGVSLSAAEKEAVGSEQVLMRNYSRAQGAKVNFYVLYSPHDRHAGHPPEICFTADGYELLNQAFVPLKIGEHSLQAVRSVFSDHRHWALVYHWYRAQRQNTPRYLEQQMLSLIAALRGDTGGSAMIRIMVESTSDNVEALEQSAQEFIQGPLEEIIRTLP